MGKQLQPGRRLEELVKGSMDYTMSQIRRAFYRQFREVWEDEWNYWIEEIFAEYVVVGDYSLASDEFWQVPYERQGGTYVFAARDQWQQIELAYRPQTVEESRKQKILGSANPHTRKWVERIPQAIRLEEAAAGQPRYISGVGVSADVVNGNGRRYPSAVLRAAVSEAEGHLHESLGQGRLGVTGEAEHPSDKSGRPTFLETIVRWEEVAFDEDEGRVRIRGRILETQQGRDAIAIMEGGVLPAISMRAYGRSRMVDENGRKVEEVTELTITGFDLLSPGEQSDPNAGITLIERKEPKMDPEEILKMLRESGEWDKLKASLQKELLEAMASQDQARKEKALREALGLKPEDNLLEAMLALATSQAQPEDGAELEAQLRESLGLRDTDNVAEVIGAREARLHELEAAEMRRQVNAYVEREVKSLKYPPWMEKQLTETLTSLAPASVEDAKKLIAERRKEYDGVMAQLELAARGHHHGVEVLGPVIERERGVPAYARGAFEITEAMIRRNQFVERDLRQPRSINERFAAEYLERFDNQYRHYLLQEAKLLEEAEQASDLNLPYSISRAVVAEAFPRLIATSVFDVGLATSQSERVYYEAYSGESGSTATVTDEAVTADDGAWVSLANNHLQPGTVVITSSPAGTTYTEGTDYTIDYLNGRMFTIVAGAITDAQALLADYTYYAYRKGEMVSIERGKGTLSYTTLEMEGDRLATQISTEAVIFSRSQIGWDATARTLSMLVRQIQRRIDQGLLYLALAASLSVASNSGGTWTAATDPVSELVEKIGVARVLVGNRYYEPTSILCSLTNADRMANWDGFSAAGQRPDADLNANGYVGRLKGLPVFESTEHSDSYIVVCNREVVLYRVFQAMMLKGPYPSYDATTHELVAADQYYAEQFSGADAPVRNKAAYVVIA